MMMQTSSLDTPTPNNFPYIAKNRQCRIKVLVITLLYFIFCHSFRLSIDSSLPFRQHVKTFSPVMSSKFFFSLFIIATLIYTSTSFYISTRLLGSLSPYALMHASQYAALKLSNIKSLPAISIHDKHGPVHIYPTEHTVKVKGTQAVHAHVGHAHFHHGHHHFDHHDHHGHHGFGLHL